MRPLARSIPAIALGTLGIGALTPTASAQPGTVLQIDPGTSRLAITVTVAGYSETAWTTPQGSMTLDLIPAAGPTSVALRDLRVDHAGPWYYYIPFPPFGSLPLTFDPLSVRYTSPGSPTPPAPLAPQSGEFMIPPIEVQFAGRASYSTDGPICGFRLNGVAPCSLVAVLNDQDPAMSAPSTGHLHPTQAGLHRVSLTVQAVAHLESEHPEYGSVAILAFLEALQSGTPACRADFNGAGGVTIQDLFDYLAAWFTSAPAADMNNTGTVTPQDLFDFLGLWFTGC